MMQLKPERFNTFPSVPQESVMYESDPLISLHSPSLDNTLESLVSYSFNSKSKSTSVPSSIEPLKNHSDKFMPIENVFMFMPIGSAATADSSQTHSQRHDPSREEKLAIDSEKIICFAPSTPHKENNYCCSSSSGRAAGSCRLKWSEDLHELFVQCVKSLGGAKKATPKEILRLMNYDGLTIFHVKSHLQKYRTSRYISASEEFSLPLTTTGYKIEDALKVQIDIQRQLSKQLEDQRNLQLRLEEQRKQLETMIDQMTKMGDRKST